MTTKPPAEPLRLFLRGFLRDHLGHSNIVADSLSVIFIERWLSRKDGTADRYNTNDDIHTLAAAFNRRLVEEASLGTSNKDKAMLERKMRSAEDKAEAFESKPRNFGLRQRAPTSNLDLVDLGTGKVAGDRQTFEVPAGHYAVRDRDGRATGEIRPNLGYSG